MGLSKYTYEQLGLDSGLERLTEAEKKALDQSWAAAFASDIFPFIDEQIFVPLFSGDMRGKRNVPVNVIVGAMLLQELRQMTEEEIAEAAAFDLRMRIALHVTNMVGRPFSARTMERFRGRLKKYLNAAGENLLRTCFGKIGDRIAAFILQYEKRSAYYAAAAAYGKGLKPESGSAQGEISHTAADALAFVLADGALYRTGFSMEVVRDPETFKENCLPAHSDHVFFASEEELEAGQEEFAGKAGSSSLRLSLNGLWKFSYAERPADAPEEFESLSFDCRKWADIPVPAHIQMQGYDVPAYINYQYPWDGREDLVPGEIPEQFNPTASYVKYFEIPETMQAYLDQGSPLCISFQGVESGFALWCNGRYVGYSEDSFTPSEFDLTPYICEGENKLAVRVFKWTASSWLESQDFFRFSGIFRDVYLYTMPTAHFYDLKIRPTLDESLTEGTLEVDAELWICGRPAFDMQRASEENAGEHLYLYYELTKKCQQAEGQTPAKDMVCVLTGRIPVENQEEENRKHLQIREKIEQPALWSAEDPQLYDLTLRLVCERNTGAEAENRAAGSQETASTDQERTAVSQAASTEEITGAAASQEDAAKESLLVEIVRERVGFRRFEMKDGLMCLNGKRIVFRGVNRHEFTCDSGRVVPDEITKQDLIVMKQNNINAVRTCHYPNSSALYRLCDELGLYLIAENNMESHASWAPVEAGLPTPGIVPKDDTRWLDLLLDRINSCYQRDKNHPAILIWSVGNESFGGTVIRDMADRFRALDCDRLVHYEGIFHDRSCPETSDMESQMYPSAEAIEAFLQEHRDKPFICCEYTHAMGNSCGGMHRYTDLTLREPLYQGGFIWDFVDQSLRRQNRYGEEFQAYGGDSGERPTDYDFSGNGILDGTRRPYAGKMQEVKYNYQDIRIRLSDSASEPPCVKIMNDSLFTDTSKYRCVVILEKNGEKIAEEDVYTDVPPLGEAGYPLPEKISALLAKNFVFTEKNQSADKRIFTEKDNSFRAMGGKIPGFPDEYCVTVSMRLREKCAWAEEGHEVAFGQGIFRAAVPETAEGNASGAATLAESAEKPAFSNEQPAEADTVEKKPSIPAAMQKADEKAEAPALPEEISGTEWRRTIPVETPYGKLELTRGSFNTGIRGEHFDALFSVLQGGLVSFRSDRIGELLEKIPKPCFWRAITSNDTGCRMAARHGVWEIADAYQVPHPETLRIFTDTDSVFLQMQCELPVPVTAAATDTGKQPFPAVTVGYRFYADGMLTMTLDWEPLPDTQLPDMPVFGFQFSMKADYDRFTFYGKGPAENYCDRNRGARLGIFQSTVKDNMSPYLVPQECGNRTGVRWAQVTDRWGRGLRFIAGDPHRTDRNLENDGGKPQANVSEMEFSALPYTARELESAAHPYELPPVHHTNVRCAWMQMGVGGDDSWGAQTLPQYCLPTDRPLHFAVTIQGV